jgi:hypothetical protein
MAQSPASIKQGSSQFAKTTCKQGLVTIYNGMAHNNFKNELHIARQIAKAQVSNGLRLHGWHTASRLIIHLNQLVLRFSCYRGNYCRGWHGYRK